MFAPKKIYRPCIKPPAPIQKPLSFCLACDTTKRSPPLPCRFAFQESDSMSFRRTGTALFALYLTAACLGSGVPVVFGAEPAKEDVEFFEKKIRPVLAEHCFKCHSEKAEKLKG